MPYQNKPFFFLVALTLLLSIGCAKVTRSSRAVDAPDEEAISEIAGSSATFAEDVVEVVVVSESFVGQGSAE